MRFIKQKTVGKVVAAVLAIVLLAASATYTAEAKAKYSQVDAFAETTTLKGLQGVDTYGYGSQHDIRSFFIEECILSADHEWVQKGYVLPFEYEGENYYFCLPKNPFNWLRDCNEKGITTSIVFLTRYNENALFMIDEASRVPGHTYYAPATTGEGAKQFRALFAYLCELCIEENCHIDNFILGNEVNMPNQWHYSGSTDPNTCAVKYADAFYNMYSVVRQYSEVSRCSISLDHSWQHNDEGRGIAAKDFLNIFAARLNNYSPDIDWCISYHMYPAILFETDIWATNAHITAEDLNPKNEGARFVDGNNLYIMTNYVKNTFGEQHRIMLTEQGFSNYFGDDIQAAALAYSFYAAKYDPMVDSFLVNIENAGVNLNFNLSAKAAETYRRLDSGKAEDIAWIDANVLPTIGVSSWADIVPNYGQNITRYHKPVTPDLPDADVTQVTAFVDRLYDKVLGRTADADGLNDWVNKLCERDITGAVAAQGFFFSREFEEKNLSDAEFVELLYNVLMNRASDEGGKSDWLYKLQNGVSREGVFRGFAESTEFSEICNTYGIVRGNVGSLQGRDRNPNLTVFVSRLYTKALDREYEVDGLNTWCNRVCDGEWALDAVSTEGFFHSEEFQNKDLSDEDYIKVLYRTFFDREYDEDGFNYWMEKLEEGASRDDILNGFAGSVEFAKLKASFGL